MLLQIICSFQNHPWKHDYTLPFCPHPVPNALPLQADRGVTANEKPGWTGRHAQCAFHGLERVLLYRLSCHQMVNCTIEHVFLFLGPVRPRTLSPNCSPTYGSEHNISQMTASTCQVRLTFNIYLMEQQPSNTCFKSTQ